MAPKKGRSPVNCVLALIPTEWTDLAVVVKSLPDGDTGRMAGLLVNLEKAGDIEMRFADGVRVQIRRVP